MKSAKFKDSPLGPIPQDWEVKRLGDVWARFSTGPFGSALHASDYVEDGTPVVNPMHILDGKIVPSKDMRINDETLNRLSSYRLRKNDIILGRRGEMGRAALVTAKEDGWLCGTGSFSITLDSSVSPDYIALYIRTPNCITAMENGAIGTTIPNLNQVIVSNIPIALPPLPEQQRIAEALGEVDNLIDSLDAQIEKKRLIAKGVGHDLLSGKKRLPGFKEKWKSVALDEIGVISKGSGISRAESNTGSIPAVRYGEIYTHHDKVVLNYVSRISDAVAQRATPLKKGDVLFAASGETVEEIGKAVAIKDDGVFAGGDTIVFSPYEELPPTFLGHLLNSPYVQEQKSVVGHGATIVHIKPKEIGRLRVSLPAKAEQQAIADLLSEQDATIAALEAKREKYVRIKDGMMRDLLTGKVRLKGEYDDK